MPWQTISWRSMPGWDEEILALELQSLLEIDRDFDVGITGFSVAEMA
jgi:hypothetical protein